MKKSIITTVLVQFVQVGKKGETVVNAKPIEIEGDNLQEIAGTVVKRILFARLQLAKYGAKIGGFSFNRKFNTRITINDNAPIDFTELYGLDGVDCSRTLIVDKSDAERTEKIFKGFADQIFDLVRLSLTDELMAIESFDNVKKTIPSKVSEVSSVKQLAEAK